MQENGKSKTALCLEMLRLLNTGKTYTVRELAEELETNPRNIIEYKKELEEALSPDKTEPLIINKPGKYGGYKLNKSLIMPSIRLTEDEKRILRSARDYINARGDFLDADLFQSALGKVFSSTTQVQLTDETLIVPGVTLVMSNKELRNRYNALEYCIENKKKISIDYLSNDNIVKTRVYHPYKLLMRNNAWFVIGYCEKAKDIRIFKLNRIEKFSLMDQKFRVLLSYNEKEHVDEKGFKKVSNWGNSYNLNPDKEGWVHIKLKFSGHPARYVKEFKFGKNQVLTPVDKDTTILECDMQYEYEVVKFVLGYGVDCEVIEPVSLKETVKDIVKQMAKMYN